MISSSLHRDKPGYGSGVRFGVIEGEMLSSVETGVRVGGAVGIAVIARSP